jgi:flagellar biosynthesis/type III secretory pathway chaperone
MKQFRKFIEFWKVEAQKDGTLFVYGLVTAEKPDQESEVCDYESTKPLYQKLVARYAKATAAVDGMDQSIAPLREMHQLKAIGCGKSIDFDDDKKTICMGFHVVEADACKKVKAGVLIGFSQGGDYVKTWKKGPNTWYTADPGEVSLVDSPCLEDALIQQLVEKTFTYVQENGSTELRKFSVIPKKAAPDPARDGSLTRVEKIDRVRKAHELVAGTMTKSLYDVKSMVDVMNQLRSTCGWLYDEKEWEGDESEVPGKLKEILTQLATVFIELAQEETSEMLASIDAVKGAKAMKPELLKKLKELGKGTVTLTKEEMEQLAGLAEKYEALEKAGKSLHDHLQALHKAHVSNHEAMSGHIEKCMKACGGDGAAAGKSADVTFTKAELDAQIAKALEDAKKAAAAGAAPETFSKAEAQKLIDEAVEKAMKERGAAPNDPTNRAKLMLVGRDGKEITKTASDTPEEGAELSKSVGF